MVEDQMVASMWGEVLISVNQEPANLQSVTFNRYFQSLPYPSNQFRINLTLSYRVEERHFAFSFTNNVK